MAGSKCDVSLSMDGDGPSEAAGGDTNPNDKVPIDGVCVSDCDWGKYWPWENMMVLEEDEEEEEE